MRVISRSIHEDVRDRAKARARTDAFDRSQHLRPRVEHLFGAIKHADQTGDGFRRVRLRGIGGAAEQFLMVTLTKTLKRMVALLASEPGALPLAFLA